MQNVVRIMDAIMIPKVMYVMYIFKNSGAWNDAFE